VNSIRDTILLIEDDSSLAMWINDYLSNHGFDVIIVDHGDKAIEAVRVHSPNIVVLDILLPGKNGMTICRELRKFYSNPILMMTACSEENDEVQGLELGADDYLIKPVKPRVLLARITAQLRRSNDLPASNIRRFGQLCLNANSKSVTLNDEITNLSANDFEVLWLLSSRAGKVITRSELISALRGFDYDGFDRSIDIRISRLRKKLNDDPVQPCKIKTVRGKGYLFASDAW
jgi:DNA-binding response OmpR family regulator